MSSRIKVVAAIVGLLAVTKLAWGADLSLPPAPAYYNWTGLYLGLNAGYASAAVSETPSDGSGSGRATVPSGIGGAQIGYNYQIGSVVLGFEADFDGAMATKSVTAGIRVRHGSNSMDWNVARPGRLCVRPVARLRNGGRRRHPTAFQRECGRHRLREHVEHNRCLDRWRRRRGRHHGKSQRAHRIPLPRHRQYPRGSSRGRSATTRRYGDRPPARQLGAGRAELPIPGCTVKRH